MLSKEEIEKAKSWLCALKPKSECEAISKQIILLYIEQLEDNKKQNNEDRKRLEEEILDLDTRLDIYKEFTGRNIKEIEQLETDKQKLIEKLEKRRKQNNNRYGQAIDNDEFPKMYEHSGQVKEDDYILKILKGEKE